MNEKVPLEKPVGLLVGLLFLLLIVGCGAAKGDSAQEESGRLAPQDVRRALRGLPFRYSLRRVPGPKENDASFRGHAYGRYDTRLQFSIGIGDPPKEVPVSGSRVRHVIWEEESGFVFTDDGAALSKGATAAQWEEIATMSVAIQERLCRAATGEPCPI